MGASEGTPARRHEPALPEPACTRASEGLLHRSETESKQDVSEARGAAVQARAIGLVVGWGDSLAFQGWKD